MMGIPEGYRQKLGIRDTEVAIKMIKDTFEDELANALNLTRVSAPLFVRPATGLNDNLNGVERPVGFDIKETGEEVQIVQSLAKWKRMALLRYGFEAGSGLYTDMNAVRRDEELDNIHSVYVDQWDWERVISPEERNIRFLKSVVKRIMGVLKSTQNAVCRAYPVLENFFPAKIAFVTSQELEDRYPGLTPKEREQEAAREYGAVFIMGIGGELKSGKPHDLRSPDYDDWSMNGDILIWYPLLEQAVEVSSMGIRVDAQTLDRQLTIAGCDDRRELDFHRMLLGGELPLTIGGGIGQSRMCMLMLEKAHVGEVQASVWPDSMVKECGRLGIRLL